MEHFTLVGYVGLRICSRCERPQKHHIDAHTLTDPVALSSAVGPLDVIPQI